MKKLFSFAMTVLLLLGALFGAVGCRSVNRLTKFYKQSTLEMLGLEGMPKPDFDYAYHDDIYRYIHGTIEKEEFYSYAQALFDYLNEKYEYLGIAGEEVKEPTMFSGSDYAYIDCERKLESYQRDFTLGGEVTGTAYCFCYFMETPSQENYWATPYFVSISYDFFPTKITDKEGESHVVNFTIRLKKQGNAHSYLDYERMLIDCYEAQYPECGEASVLHCYGQSADDRLWFAMMTASDLGYDQAIWAETVAGYRFYYPDGNRILVEKASLGEEKCFYTLTEAYENGWVYSQDLQALEEKHRACYPELYENTAEKLSAYETWLRELTAEEIAEVKTTAEYVGVAPGSLKDIVRTTDKAVIADIFGKYQGLEMSYIPKSDAEISGGGAFTIEFILMDGSVKTLYFNNGIYRYDKPELSALCYFDLTKMPTLEGYENVTNAHSFVTYQTKATLYLMNGESLGEMYDLTKLEFVIVDEEDVPRTQASAYIKGEILLYICSDTSSTFFYREIGRERVYYQLVNGCRFDILGNG